MATAETEVSRDGYDQPGGEMVYDGFISYSHAADDLLAPRLQAGLQRFAKPWWKRRALRIFRDESSLSANPHLWSSITDALDTSDWFVLLLSPDASNSEWVNNEVEYWLAHKDPSRIIPVVTDGSFRWEGDDFVSDAAPPALHGAFFEDPRWVDLRFARSDEQLDLKNPQFSAAVADIASAIRGVPKDELESEEVREHRRTVRTAWAAGAVVLLLALLAGAAALFALDQRNDANANAAEADAQRDIAEERQAEAEAATAAESAARLEADRSALAASSNELALRAEKEILVDAERAMLLAIEAIGRARGAGIDPIEATRALRSAVGASRIVQRLPAGNAEYAFVAVASDGSMLATVSGVGVGIWDTSSWELVATFEQPGATSTGAAFSPTGDRVAVAYEQAEPGNLVSAVVVYDLSGGPAVRLDGEPNPPHSGPQVAFATSDMIVSHTEDPDAGRGIIGVWSAADGTIVHLFEDSEGPFSVDPQGERVAVIIGDRLRIYDVATRAVLVDVGGSDTNTSIGFSPSGTRLAETSQGAGRLMIRDASNGDVMLSAEIDRIAGIAWLDESRVAVGGEGSTRIVDTATGEILFELAGHNGIAWSLAAVPGTERLATASFDGYVLSWDVSTLGSTELPVWDSGLSDAQFHWAGPNGSLVIRHDTDTGWSLWVLADDGSPATLVLDELVPIVSGSTDGTHFDFTRTDGSSGVITIPDGEVVYVAPEGRETLGVNNDASLVVLAEPFDLDRLDELAPVVVETATGTEVGELTPPLDLAYYISPDSSIVSHNCCGAENTSAYLLPGGEPTGSVDFSFGGFFSTSGALLAYPQTEAGIVWLIDTEMLKETKDLDSARVAEISAHSGIVFGAFSPDESMMVTSTFDEPVKVWDIASVLDGVEPTLIAEIDVEARSGPPSTTFGPNNKHIVVRSIDGKFLLFTVDTDELIAIARSRLTKGLTPEDCVTFGIDPCPIFDGG